MSNERRRRELEVLSAADALVRRLEGYGGGMAESWPQDSKDLWNAMRALRSFEDDEAEAEAAYEQAVAEPVPEGSEWGLTQQAVPPDLAEEPTRGDERWAGLDRRIHSIEGVLAHSRLPNIEAWLGRLDDRVAVVEERLRAQPAGSDSGRASVVVHAVSGDFCWLPPGATVHYDPEGPWPRSVQLPPHDERGVIAVAEAALGKICRELAQERWFRQPTPRPSWRGAAEEVRLVWDEFLSGHDARLLP